MGCPKSPIWECGDEAWSEDESASSDGFRGNVGNDALHVIGLFGLGDKISLFLKDWELAKVALSCHMALDMLCQEMELCRLSCVDKEDKLLVFISFIVDR